MINLATLKEVMLENRKEVELHDVVSRDVNISDFGDYVLVGVRRSGKSYILYGRMQQLLREGYTWDDMLYLNFEDERLAGMELSDLNAILEVHGQLSSHRPMLFLDEIQNIDGWEQFVRRLSDNKYRIVVTGSNAKMLSRDVAAKLSGRFIIKEVYPYSFKEFLFAKGLNVGDDNLLDTTTGRSEVMRFFDEYFSFGGFPECLSLESKRDYLTSLYQKVYLSDIAVRNGITNVFGLRIMFRKLAESVKQPTSITRIANIVSSTGAKVGKTTMANYIEYSKEAYLLLNISNMADNLADKVTNPKYYFVDNGIISILAMDVRTSLLENLIAVSLIRRYGTEEAVFFYNRNVEVDFYVPEAGLAIQVSYSIYKDDDTFKRETLALAKLQKQFSVEQALIITYNESDSIEVDGCHIEVVPAWKWLLR